MDNAYAAALAELNQYHNFERSGEYPAGSGGLGTKRCEELLSRLGHPETAAPAVHIAGTKGKGSTACLTAALLRARGWRVGLYTSPHVVCLRERIQVDGHFVSRGDFAAAFARVRAAAAELDSRPTYFEMLTAVAFTVFAGAVVDAMVIEVGLGGRLDATNVATLPVAASCVTTVSLDHTQILGDTLDAIAREKAGIIRRHTPVVVARQAPAAREVVMARAAELESPVLEIGRSVTVEDASAATGRPLFNLRLGPGVFPGIPERVYERLPLNLPGAHQRENAAAAFALAGLLCEARQAGHATREDLVRAWKNIRIPGRTEAVPSRPPVILDGAHNPASAWALAETLRERFPGNGGPRTAVISISRDKNIRETLRVLLPSFGAVFFTANRSDRSATPEELLAAANALFPERADDWHAVAGAGDALEQARDAAGPDGLVCVTGSFYLVGDLRPQCLNIPEED